MRVESSLIGTVMLTVGLLPEENRAPWSALVRRRLRQQRVGNVHSQGARSQWHVKP